MKREQFAEKFATVLTPRNKKGHTKGSASADFHLHQDSKTRGIDRFFMRTQAQAQ
jgi:hypothetical protein